MKYRATRDGFSAKDFHNKCDGIPNTLTIIKSENGNIFGGLKEQSWSSYNWKRNDQNAYVFSLVNKENNPFKVMCSLKGDGNYGLWNCDGNYGPVFGGDITIVTNSNANQKSWTDFGRYYKHSDYEYGTMRAQSILAGSNYFKTLEIEVLQKI